VASNADQYALEATDRLKQAFQFVYEYSGRVAYPVKSNYGAAIKEKHFDVGSYVLVFTPPKQQSHVYGKWKVAWQGPYRVMKQLNSTNYVVKRSHKAKDFVVHGDRLRKYRGHVDSTAWPAAKFGDQQSVAAGSDSTTTDLDATDHVRDKWLAQSTLAQSDSALPPRRHKRVANHSATSSGGTPAVPVSIKTDINYANDHADFHDGPIADDNRRTLPSRDQRRPARYLTRLAASDVAVGERKCRIIESYPKVIENLRSCEELSRESSRNCSSSSSVCSGCRCRICRTKSIKVVNVGIVVVLRKGAVTVMADTSNHLAYLLCLDIVASAR